MALKSLHPTPLHQYSVTIANPHALHLGSTSMMVFTGMYPKTGLPAQRDSLGMVGSCLLLSVKPNLCPQGNPREHHRAAELGAFYCLDFHSAGRVTSRSAWGGHHGIMHTSYGETRVLGRPTAKLGQSRTNLRLRHT